MISFYYLLLWCCQTTLPEYICLHLALANGYFSSDMLKTFPALYPIELVFICYCLICSIYTRPGNYHYLCTSITRLYPNCDIYWCILTLWFSIRLPESHRLQVESITEYGNARTKCQYVHEMPIRSRLIDGHSILYSKSRTKCQYVSVLSSAC